MIASALLNATVEIEPLDGNASMGPVYGESVIEKVRFDGKRRRVKNASGEDIITSGTILARPDSVLNMGSKVMKDGRAYVVIEVLPISELNRVSHLEVLLT